MFQFLLNVLLEYIVTVSQSCALSSVSDAYASFIIPSFIPLVDMIEQSVTQSHEAVSVLHDLIINLHLKQGLCTS